MKTYIVTLIVAVGLVAFSLAGAVEFSLTGCRDVLYRPGHTDSLVQPASALLGVGFKGTGLGMLVIRAGYSGYQGQTLDDESGDEVRRSLHGVRVEVLPLLKLQTPARAVSVLGGIGISGRRTAYSHWHTVVFHSEDRRDVSTSAVDQSFLLGLAFELSRRFGADIEAERVGFSISRADERTYHWDRRWKQMIQQDLNIDVSGGWVTSAPTGIGVGLRLKL